MDTQDEQVFYELLSGMILYILHIHAKQASIANIISVPQ